MLAGSVQSYVLNTMIHFHRMYIHLVHKSINAIYNFQHIPEGIDI